MSDNIKVAIKVRPLIAREREDNLTEQWTIKENSLMPNTGSTSDIFYFDHVFDTLASNNDVYNAVVAPITTAAVNGFNGTIFAYGQTSSGKTYTMIGSKQEKGVTELVVNDIFKIIASHSNREFLLRASFIEIYNEKIHDLLDNSKNKPTINVYEDVNGVVKLNVKEEISNTPEHVLEIMRRGEKNRRIGETNMNERSSRSHTIFRIIIESRISNDPDGVIQVAHLNLVDLAGSERVSQTGATGVRLREGTHINLSLLTLSRVINQLSDTTDPSRFISFRDSKLTRILQSSLGGNAKTVIICAITPASLEESFSTLSFASRAKSIKNKPQVNEIVSNDTLLKRYANQISMLQVQLEHEKNANINLQSNQEETSLVNQRLQERICLLQKYMLKAKITSVKPIESVDKTSKRRQTWSAPNVNISSVAQRKFNKDSRCMNELKSEHNFNQLTIDNSAVFIPEHFKFDLNNSLLLREHIQKENETVPMEQFELDLIECVKNQINESSSTTAAAVPLQNSFTETNRGSDYQKIDLENLKEQLAYYKNEYETTKDFVNDENIILNECIFELKKENEIIQEENGKLQDLLNHKDVELNLLKIKLNELNIKNGCLLNDDKSIAEATTRLLLKKNEILQLKNDIDRQINSFNRQDVDTSTDCLRRLRNKLVDVLNTLDLDSKVLISMQRVNLRNKLIIHNLKAPHKKLDTIIEQEDDVKEDLDLIQVVVTDILRLQTMIQDMNNQIDYLETYNKRIKRDYEMLRDDFSDQSINLNQLTMDNKKLEMTIDNLESEKYDLEQKCKKFTEFEKQIQEEKVFWEELQRKHNILKQRVDSLQETQNDNDLKMKHLEETYLMKIRETTVELQNQLDNVETCKRSLECEIEIVKHKNTRLDFTYKHIQDNYNELQQLHSEFYHDLYKLKCRFEKLIQASNVEQQQQQQQQQQKELELVAQYRWLIDAVEKYQQNQDILKFEYEIIVSKLNSEITILKTEIGNLKNNKQVETQCLDSMKQELQVKEAKISELETEIEECKKLNLEQYRDIQEHQEKIKQLEEIEINHKHLTENSNEEIISVKTKLEMKNAKIYELETEIEEIKQQNHDIHELQDQIQNLVKELEETNLRHKNYSEEVINSKKEFDNSINTMKQELKMKADKIYELEKEIEDRNTLNSDLNMEILNHKNKVQDLMRELAETECNHKQLEDSVNSFNQELKKKNAKISELETEIEEIKKLNLEQNHEIQEHQEKIKHLEEIEINQTNRTKNSIKEITNVKKELEDSINSFKQELEVKNAKIFELEMEIEEIKKLNLIQNHDIQDLVKELKEIKLKYKNYSEEVINSKKELDDSIINTMKQELEMKNIKIYELETEIKEIKMQNSQISKSEFEIKLKQCEEKYNNKIYKLNKEVEKLTEANEMKTQSFKQARCETVKIQAQRRVLEELLYEKEVSMKQLESTNHKLQTENLSLEKSLKQDIQSKDIIIKSLETKISNFKLEEIKSKDIIIHNLQSNIERLEQELKEAILKYDKLESKDIKSLETEISNLKHLERTSREQLEEIKSKNVIIQNLQTNIERLEQELEETTLKCEKLEPKDINSLETEISNLKHLERTSREQFEEINVKNTNVIHTDIKSKDVLIQDLETRLLEVEKSNQSISESFTFKEQLMRKHVQELKRQLNTEKKILIKRLEVMGKRNDELSENYSIQLFTETEYLEDKIKELKQQLELLKDTNSEQNNTILKYEDEIKSLKETIENSSKELLEKLQSKDVIIENLNTQILELNSNKDESNHNGKLGNAVKENYEIKKYKNELKKLTEANKMKTQSFKQALCENEKIQAKLTLMEDKYKEKEISVTQLQSRIQELEIKNNELRKLIEEIVKEKENASTLLEKKLGGNDCKNCSQMITISNHLELEIVSLKSENGLNIEKIHDLEDEVMKLSVPHRSNNTPSSPITIVRRNRLSSSKRNELFDESRRVRMEQELFEAETSSRVPEKHDKEVQANILFQDKQLYEMTKKKNFYKELAILRKKELLELQNKPPQKPMKKMVENLQNA